MPKRQLEPDLRFRFEDYFKHFSYDFKKRIVNLSLRQHFSAHKIIFFPDDPCDRVFFLRSGRVKLSKISNNQREFCFRQVAQGNFFGDECLLKLPRRGYYATALVNTDLMLIHRSDITRLLQEEAEFSYAVSCALCQRNLDTERSLNALAFLTVRERVLQSLYQRYVCDDVRQDRSLTLTHRDLAQMVSASRETVTKVLQELQQEDIIVLGNRSIEIKDPKVLSQLAGIL